MSRKLFNIVAEESIKWQNGAFFGDLIEVFEELLEAKLDSKNYRKADAIARLANCIKIYTNITVVPRCDDMANAIGPAVFPPDLNNNSIFRNWFTKNQLGATTAKKELKDVDYIVGNVNFKTSKVSGIFEKMECVLYIPEWILNNKLKFTTREIAAIYLHEIGHIFTFCEFCDRMVSTNQVLSLLHKEYANAVTEDDRIKVITTATKALKLKVKNEDDISKLAKIKRPEIVSVTIIRNCVENVISELGNNVYDITASEQLADEFAVRHGAGVDLVTALDKFHREMGLFNVISYRSNFEFIVIEMLKVASLITVFFTKITATIPGLILYNIALNIVLMLVIGDASTYELAPHDKPEARYRRVKEQLINRLKTNKLDKESTKKIHEGISSIDNILATIKDKRGIIELLFVYMIPGMKKRHDLTVLQQELESLANNELFLKASELKIA